MSTLVRCKNGHYYDAQKFSSCPYCVGESADAASEMTAPMPDQWPGDISATVPDTAPSKPIASVADDLDKTVGMAVWTGDKHEGEGLEEKVVPVVGWLVCIKGPAFGKSFTLKAGRNFVGRADSNDVVIKGDNAISREKHGIIVFDPKAKKFHVQPGESSELFYVNDNVVLQVMELNDKDTVSLGETELMFVALCGEDFSWEGRLRKED